MNHKHTPGPWHFGVLEGGDLELIELGCLDVIARVGDYAIRFPKGEEQSKGIDEDLTEMEANAALIAAAPDLLVECEWMNELLIEASQLAYNHEVAKHMPGQLEAKLKSWNRSVTTQRAIAKARGERG